MTGAAASAEAIAARWPRGAPRWWSHGGRPGFDRGHRRRHDRESPPARSTTVVDTTGAGDSFAAGFPARPGAGADPETCARLGGVVAAELVAATSALGPSSRWPSWPPPPASASRAASRWPDLGQ